MKRVKFQGERQSQEIMDQYVSRDGYVFVGEENHGVENNLMFDPPTKYHTKTETGWEIDEESWLDNEVRFYRDYLLEKSDFSQLEDVKESYSKEDRLAWRKYRKDLRDLTKNITTLGVRYTELPWPERPDNKKTLDILEAIK